MSHIRGHSKGNIFKRLWKNDTRQQETRKRDHDKQELIKLEHLKSLNETRAFYQKENRRTWKEFQPRTTLCKENDGAIWGIREATLEEMAKFFMNY
jgi:hypothetical protein